MTMSQILKSVDFTETQKSRYLENETSFSFPIKKSIGYTSRATLRQKQSCSGGNRNSRLKAT